MRADALTRHALVSGGSGGIGSAIVASLLAAGHRVTTLDCVAPESGSQGPSAAAFYQCDLADESQRAELLTAIPTVDILVNNAARFPRTPILELRMVELREVLEVNLVAALDLMSRYGACMARSGWGRIVNITSITALGGFRDLGAYAASKAGLMGASVVAAAELGASGITVNCVAPGAIPTAAEPEGTDDAAVLAKQSLGFRGSPEDVAAVVSFLVTEQARFVTGQTIQVDGGWRMS